MSEKQPFSLGDDSLHEERVVPVPEFLHVPEEVKRAADRAIHERMMDEESIFGDPYDPNKRAD